MNKRNRGACAKVHNEIKEMAETHLFKDIVAKLNIPRTTLKDYCNKHNITVNHGFNDVKSFVDEIERLASEGYHTKAIAEKLKLDVNSVRYHIKKHNINVRNGKYIVEDTDLEEDVIRLFNEGLTYLEIAEKLDIPDKRIPKYLDKHNISKRLSEESRHLQNKTNLKAFSDMTKEEDVYWLGWIITDGCLTDNNVISLSLKGSDYQILESFRNYVCPNLSVKTIEYFHKQMKKTVSTASVTVASKEIADNLRAQNVEPRKSCREKLPNFDYIVSTVAPVFWRACIEGDGYVSKVERGAEISLVGSEELLTGFVNFCEERCNVKVGKKLRKRNYGNPDFRLVSYTGTDAVKIMQVLWSHGSIFLDRKKIIVEQQLSKYNNKCNRK